MIKKVVVFFLICSTLPLEVEAQQIQFSPKRPHPGEELTVKYRSAGSLSKESEGIKASVYLLEDAFPEENIIQLPLPRPVSREIVLDKKGNFFQATVSTTYLTKLVMVVFYNDNNWLDNNGGKGYSLIMTDRNNGRAVQGGHAQLALTHLTHAYFMGLQEDPEAAFEAMAEEMDQYPSSKDHFVYYMTYAGLARQLDQKQVLAKVEARLEKIQKMKNAGEMELSLAFALSELFERKESAQSLYQKIKAQYPRSFVVEFETLDRFYETESLKEKEDLFQFLKENFSENERQVAALKEAAYAMAMAFLPTDADRFGQYARLSRDKTNLASQANAMAWQLAGGGIRNPAAELDRAEKLAKVAVELVKMEMTNKKNTSIEAERLNDSYAAFTDTYALVFYKKGKTDKAMEYQQISLEHDPEPALDVVDRYALYFDKTHDREATRRMLAEKIRQNQFTSRMKERFLELAGNEELQALLEASKEHFYAGLRLKMINEAAPGFSLKNLDGKTVELSDLKGKIVVLDFWASWCAPCLASFPGMQEVIDHYEKDDEVVFLFINCWENTATTNADISQFLAENNYSFKVLPDEKNRVAKAYGVEGIPAKFVIDGAGRVRFQSSGFSGKEELVKELSGMIEVLRKN